MREKERRRQTRTVIVVVVVALAMVAEVMHGSTYTRDVGMHVGVGVDVGVGNRHSTLTSAEAAGPSTVNILTSIGLLLHLSQRERAVSSLAVGLVDFVPSLVASFRSPPTSTHAAAPEVPSPSSPPTREAWMRDLEGVRAEADAAWDSCQRLMAPSGLHVRADLDSLRDELRHAHDTICSERFRVGHHAGSPDEDVYFVVVGISTAHAAVLRALRNYIRPSLHDSAYDSGYDSGYRGGSLDGSAAAAITVAAPLDASDYVRARRRHVFIFLKIHETE
mmetsp:Transcript_59968/g.164972  ORF Transcript_59968/g.164972 Transcript_59968/m.164972 type:complete len:277 (+) Transcript_59968:21-851(+)